ncbi:hypothetical protein [Paraburkholderia sp. PGU16]|uniref:Uncharacterized protein n=1 Tax=Paraburkholderia largidicola TaxID=3014751 RepID=A0A7I8C2M2_9BURK|nr:hypothetical protein [Paraburkholderia sp. PGU16]BCF95336.1 hypothetical protein PPGU16_84030 [Paraburkholderia sp. PGU16]BEU28152.1 hypothetical protein PBP221_82920 [Paraburkholderia sp. 22B1P]GJH37632.1 hypothetical protein CBA19CS91_32765 [Paraburkholderia hospita]
MNREKTVYLGYSLQALAAYDDGSYASMYIVRPPGGTERVSPVLGHFASPADAVQFALRRAKTDVDHMSSGESRQVIKEYL